MECTSRRYDTTHYGVKRIYDSVLSALASHPHRKFIPVEILFLSRWWQVCPARCKKNPPPSFFSSQPTPWSPCDMVISAWI